MDRAADSAGRDRSVAQDGNGVPRQHGWRATPGRSLATSPGRRRTLALILTLAAAICGAVVLGLLLGPLFAWQTAVVTLTIDRYRLGVLEPVPFAAADTAAIEASVARAPGAAFGGKAVVVDGAETIDGMRDLLLPKMTSLPLRAKDVLLAYVRGQTLAAPPVFDAEGMPLSDQLAERACIVASDCTIRGARPRELIPIRDVVEAIGAATSRTTLVFIDLGDIHWDPRLGTMAHVVPKLLDEELKAAQKKARGDVWVLGSQDVFQVSEVSLPNGRTYFSRAVEMALAGAADREGCGDGDGVVELDEVTRYVTTWTSEWVRRASGGRHQQTPVLWKLGTGRVALDGLPPSVGLVRVGRKPAALTAAPKPAPADAPKPLDSGSATPTPVATRAKDAPATILRMAGEEPLGPRERPTPSGPEAAASPAELAFPGFAPQAGSAPPAAVAPPAAAAPPVGTAPAAAATPSAPTPPGGQATAAPSAPPSSAQPQPGGPASAAATPEAVPPAAALSPAATAAPPATAAQPRDADAWDGLTRLGKRDPAMRRGRAATPTLGDLAPHVWSELYAFAAAATTTAEFDMAANRTPNAALRELARVLAAVPPPPGRDRRPDPGNSALSAWLAAEDGGVFRAWSDASPPLTAALATFDDGVSVARSTLDVVGNVTGGANDSPVDLGIVAALLEKLGALRAAVAENAGNGLADSSPADVRALSSLTRAVGTQTGLAADQIDHLIEAMLSRGPTDRGGASFQGCTAALRSPALLPVRRDALLRAIRPDRQADGTAAAAAFATWGGAMPPQVEYGRVEPTHLAAIASLTDMLATLVTATVGARGPGAEGSTSAARIAGALADLRREIVAIVEPFASEKVAVSRIVKLGGRVAELHAVIAAVAEEPRTGVLDFGDVAAAALRLIDGRDVSALTGVSVVGLPSRVGPGAIDVAIVRLPAAALGPGESAEVQVAIGKTQRPADDPRVRFVYEPADLDVRILNGERLDPQRSVPLSQIAGAGGDVTLVVTVLSGAGGREAGGEVPLAVRCESQGRTSSAEARIRIVGDRAVALAVRRNPAERSGSQPMWRFARPARGATASDETAVVLPGLAGRIVTWELGLENRSGIPRTVAAELHSLSAPSGVDPWPTFAARVAAGKGLPAPLAAAPAVSLGKDRAPVVLALTPTPAEPLPSPAGAAGEPPKQPESPVRPVGPDLALVVRETTPGEPARRWLHRLRLAVEHPRDLFEATATWIARDRTIRVQVAARDPRAATLDEPVVVTLGTLDADSLPQDRFVQVRRGTVTLSRRTPADTLVAEWTGPERDSRAWLAVGVNGYPRAFVFGVSCSPATDGQPQQPQGDWRRVRIAAPTERLTLVRAPVATFPMELLLDAPPDARSGDMDDLLVAAEGEPLGRLLLREARAGSIARDPGRVAWTASSDRRIDYLLEKPQPPATLAISTVVEDWRIEVPGEGFVDVDVEAEAGLSIPGAQRPLTAATRFVFDGRPPVVEAPASVNAVVGRRLVIPLQVTDDPREAFATNAGVRLPGVSGVARVEWAVDAKGDGKPEAWKPASSLEGGRYEATVETTTFVPGVRLAVLVRATDRVGLAAPPTRVWVEVGRKPAKGSIRGTVKLDGRGEQGVTVSADGPGGPAPVRSGADGTFVFPDLEPGEYKVSARGAVRNRTRTAAPASVTVPPPPAEPPTVTLELK